MMFNTNTPVSWEGGCPNNLPCGVASRVYSVIHPGDYFIYGLGPGQITYYITVHLVSKDTLTTPLNKDEKSCGVFLPRAFMCVSLLHVYVCACMTVCTCHKIQYTKWLPQQRLSLYRHYYTFLSCRHSNITSIYFVSTLNSSSVNSLCTD